MSGAGAGTPLDDRVFAGKIAYARTGQSPAWLDFVERRDGNERLYLPIMAGKGQASGFPATVYGLPDGTFRIQMRNRMWIARTPLSIMQLLPDIADAAVLRLAGSPLGQSWEVQTPAGFVPLGYDPDLAEPLLTTSFPGPSSFAPALVTPSLAELAKTRGAPGADFTYVRLDGAEFPEADLAGAHFDGASLLGAKLAGCALSKATFVGADLGGVVFDRATLDGADMTRARLAAPSWGAPQSARKIVLAECKASGAVLGGQKDKLDCAEAILTDGDFTGADLQGWKLEKAQLGRAILIDAKLTGAVLDGADLSDAVAVRGVFRQVSMRNARASGANFTRADLSGADLGQAQLGARAFLFQIAASLAKDLDDEAYPDQAVLAAFTAKGVVLPPQSPITVIARGERWEIDTGSALYLLLASDLGIEVFLAAADLRPATLAHALCLGTKAPGAGMAGVDLRGVQWYGAGATLDHADLEGAYLSQALLVSANFTQAFLSGCDFSGSVLVRAVFRGCRVGAGASRQPLSFEGAQLQGADFANAKLTSALLTDAGVSLPQGAPLFTLPAADVVHLTPEGLKVIAPVFEAAGYPLGSEPDVEAVKTWTIDNAVDPVPTDPRSYLVRAGRTPDDDLQVFNGKTDAFCFLLSSTFAGQLGKPHPSNTLIQAFSRNGYGLVAEATISSSVHWTITAGDDAVSPRPFGYSLFTVAPGEERLTVLGATLLHLRDWAQYAEGLAFTATTAADAALNPTCVGPAGLPMAWVAGKRLDWTAFLTPFLDERPQPPPG
ncbi:MAG: pentapeptide repeat-containing protein [Caulobacter sp.]